jgi:hypothetical protein
VTPCFITKRRQVVDSASQPARGAEFSVAFSQQLIMAAFDAGLDAAGKLTTIKVSANFFA